MDKYTSVIKKALSGIQLTPIEQLIHRCWALNGADELLEAATANLRKLEADNAALRAKLEQAREAAKPFADAYEAQKESHLSAQVCVLNMLHLTILDDWREISTAFKEQE